MYGKRVKLGDKWNFGEKINYTACLKKVVNFLVI